MFRHLITGARMRRRLIGALTALLVVALVDVVAPHEGHGQTTDQDCALCELRTQTLDTSARVAAVGYLTLIDTSPLIAADGVVVRLVVAKTPSRAPPV